MKIQLTIAINFISSKDNDEEHVMHSENDNIEIMINDKAESIFNRHEISLELKMEGSEFVVDHVHIDHIVL